MSDTTSVTFKVPKGREGCAAWLKSQTPPVVAEVLAAAQLVHESLLSARPDANVELVKSHAKQLESLRAKHLEDVRELESTIESSFVARLEDTQKKLEASQETLNAMEADRAILENRVQKRCDARLEEVRVDYEHRLKQQAQLFESQLRNVQGVQEKLLGKMEQSQHEEVAHLKSMLAKEKECNQALTEGSMQRVESILCDLTSSTSKRGQMGETFVKQIHDGLNLGVLQDETHVKQPGMADFTWSYAHPQCDVPLTAIVENTLAKTDSNAHVAKFLQDFTLATKAGRVNAGIYFSLAAPVPGKPKFHLELLEGYPVLWVGRMDDACAATLIEMGFLAMAAVWPLLANKVEGAEASLQQIGVMLSNQMEECSKLDPRIGFLERTSETMRKEAVLLRKTQEALVRRIGAFQLRHPECGMMTQVEGDGFESVVEAAIESYHSRRGGYYPKTPEDLKKELTTEQLQKLTVQPEVLQLCDRRVRAKKQIGKKKRKVEEEGEQHGGAESAQ